MAAPPNNYSDVSIEADQITRSLYVGKLQFQCLDGGILKTRFLGGEESSNFSARATGIVRAVGLSCLPSLVTLDLGHNLLCDGTCVRLQAPPPPPNAKRTTHEMLLHAC